MTDINLEGIGVALIASFREDESVNHEVLGRLVGYQAQNDTDYSVVLDTTAETPTFTKEEKENIVSLVVTHIRSRIPIMSSTGGNCIRSVIKKLKIDNFEGIDIILPVVPYHNKPSQEGIYQHYKAIVNAAHLPTVLYNAPGHTGMNMTVEAMLRIAHEFDSVIAMKEASGNITQMDDVIENKPAHFNAISGDDGITFSLMILGAVGVISAIGSVFPREPSRMVRLALVDDYDSVRTICHSFAELLSLLLVGGSPTGAKNILNMMDSIESKPCLPLIPIRIITHKKIRKVLQQLSIKC